MRSSQCRWFQFLPPSIRILRRTLVFRSDLAWPPFWMVDVSMTSNKIHERAFEFSRRVVKLCNRLAARGPAGRHIASELLKCGTSIGANSEEAEDGQTKAVGTRQSAATAGNDRSGGQDRTILEVARLGRGHQPSAIRAVFITVQRVGSRSAGCNSGIRLA